MHPLIHAIAPLGMIFAIVIKRTDRRLVEELRASGAVDAAHPATLDTRSGVKRWRLGRMISGGAIRSVGSSAVYLDENGLAAYRSARRRRALAIIATLVTIFVLGRLAGAWHL